MPEANDRTNIELPFQPVEAGKAAFLLRELDWGEHYIGISLNPAMGNSDIYVYSLKELLRFLTQGGASLGVLQGSSRVGTSWVKLSEVLDWLRNSVKDEELADVLQEALGNDEGIDDSGIAAMMTMGGGKYQSYLEELKVLAELVNLRIMQLEEALEEE